MEVDQLTRYRSTSPENGWLLEVRANAACALLVAVVDPGFEFSDQLFERRAQCVIDRFLLDVGTRRDEVRGDEEGRARFKPPLDEHASFVNLQRRLQRFQLRADERYEGGRRMMMTMSDVKFHDVRRLASPSGFDHASITKQSFEFMETVTCATQRPWVVRGISGAAGNPRTSQSAFCADVKQLEAALGAPALVDSPYLNPAQRYRGLPI